MQKNDRIGEFKKKPVEIWRWEDAPEKYRKLSEHGGDEDWVAFIPAEMPDKEIPGVNFGGFDISEHETDGGIVRIGAHG